MSAYVGVNVEEVDGLASPTIVPAATSIAAFIGVTERGPLNTPVRVSDLDAFAARFGSVIATGYLGYAVTGFFGNGGREAHVCRIAGGASAAARLDLNNRAAAPAATLRLEGGYRGRSDPGRWAERIRIDVRDDPAAATTAAVLAAANATAVRLTSADGVAVGSVIRFQDAAANPDQRKITSIDPDGTVHWTGAVVAGIAAGATVATAEFSIVVRYRTSATAPLQVVETWPRLSMETDVVNYAVERVNHPFTGSRYLLATDLSGTTASGIEAPAVALNQALQNGADAAPGPLDFVGNTAAKTGFQAFNGDSVQLLAAPDLHFLGSAGARQTVVQGAIDYCANRGDMMFVGSAPDRSRRAGVAVARARSDYGQLESGFVAAVTAFGLQFQAPKVYGALYTPWVRVADPASGGAPPTRFVPPDGHVLGIYARTDLAVGVWKPPAGISTTVRGALDVAAEFTDAQHDDLVRTGFVNGVRPSPGLGISVAASRTLSTDPRWWYVNIRLLFNFVKTSLRDGLRFVRQQPNSGALQRTVKFNVVTPFLMNLWRRGAFGSDDAKNVFTVTCDASNNPAVEVDLGNFHVDVTFYPVRPAETVVIKVGQQPTGSSASES
jgi:phage tail sheath protein FI